MKDEDKAKEQLIDELVELRKRIAKLEASEAGHKRMMEESEERYRTIVENTFDVIYTCSSDGTITYLSPQALSMGFSPEDVVGRNMAEFIHPDDVDGVLGEFQRTMQTGAGSPTIFRVINTDGKVVHVEETGKLIQDEDEIVGLRGTFRDISQRIEMEEELKKYRGHLELLVEERTGELTRVNEELQRKITEHRQAEGKLRESEEKYRTLVENASEVILVAQGAMLRFVNARATQLTGYSKDELTSRSFAEFIHPDDRETAIELYLRKLKGEETPRIYPIRIIDKDGNTKWVEAGVVLITWEGRPATMNFLTEITERRQAEEALRASARQWQTTFDGISDAICLLDVEGRILQCNKAMADFLRKPSIEIIGRKCYELVHGTSEPPEGYPIVRMRDTIRRESASWQINDRWFHVTADPLLDGSGDLMGVVHIMSDVTEQKQAEQEIRAKSQFLERLIQQSPLPTLVLDEKGILLMVNKAFLEYFSVPDEDAILGRNALTEPANVKHGVVEYIEEALSGKVVETPEIEFSSPFSDEATIVKSRLFPVFDPDGELTNVVVMHEDITERMKAEEALRESEGSYRELADSIVDIFFAFDENMRYIYWNRASEELTGIPAKDAIGKSLHDLFPDTPQTRRAERIYLDVLGTQQAQSFVNEYRFGGKDFAFEISVYPAKRGISVFVKDITERKRMEEELLKIQKLESVGTLAGGIAHDLNNLLTAVVGNISLARLYKNPADKDRRLAEAEKASMRIKDLTQQLLTFSKGGVPILQTADIAGLLRDSATFDLSGSNVRCEFSIPDDLWPVHMDEGQINQVINNLVINAQQAMPNGGTVRISVENMTIGAELGLPLEPGAYIKVSVEDEGTGIPEDHIQRIFDPFFSTKQAGSGLGLATSYSIVEKHHGYITVESQLGVGATFKIYLPASPAEVLVAEEEGEEEEKPIIGEGRVLVMDDQEEIRELASDMLGGIGYEVITAVDGTEAIELYREAMESGIPFDAAIIDLTIPGGMGGAETIQRLLEIDPEVKAIVSSGYSNDPILADFDKHGFKDVIAKPYKTREVSEILHRVIAGTD